MVHEIALTIKPTMNCNMRCKHCFNGEDLNSSEMLDVKKVYDFIESACEEYTDIKITFHGGEPTLAGVDFYKQIFEFQQEMRDCYSVTFFNNFTTNGLLLNDELIDLLISNNALINVSFDGPYNDYLRQHSQLVQEVIEKIKKKGGRVRAFCTISKGSYEHLLNIYKWFNEREIDFKILPIEPRGYAAIDRNLLMDIDSFINVLEEVYLYWLHDNDCKIRFYTFEEFASLRRDYQFKPFWFNREIALNPDGKIYPFGRPNDIQFCLGEVNSNTSIKSCFQTESYHRMLKKLEEIRNLYCSNCTAVGVCNGVCVCMSYMYVQKEELLKYSCNQSMKIFERILKINDVVIDDIKKGNAADYNKIVRGKFE